MISMNNKYILSVSYGNYLYSVGGTDKVICAHQDMFNRNNISYVYIFPLNLSNSKPINNNPFWGVIIDGKFEGAYYTSSLLNMFFNWQKSNIFCQYIHIHHLRNVNINALKKIVSLFDVNMYMYVHDYYNICVSTNLINSNTEEYCGGNAICQAVCGGCKYFEASQEHSIKFLNFINGVEGRIHFVCPSKAAEEQFVKAYPQFRDIVKVIYHQKLIGEYVRQKTEKIEKLNVAYVGSQLKHKGLLDYLRIVEQANTEEYQFYYFGKAISNNSRIKDIAVDFKTDMNAMTTALRNNEIDCVILWSTWPETYAYTYYESIAADCFVITCSNSGNIAAQVKERENGVLLGTTEELASLFVNKQSLVQLIEQYRSKEKYVPNDLQENDSIIMLSEDKGMFMLEHKKSLFFGAKILEFVMSKLYEMKIRER